MSDSLARTPLAPAWSGSPRRAPEEETPRPHIEIAPTRAQRRARPRLFYAIVACGGVAAIFVVKLLLSVALSQGAYEAAQLEVDGKQLQRDAQTVGEDLDRVKSPQYLAANAEALGMVTNSHPVYLRLSDGAVLGQPQAADGSAGLGAQNLVPNSLLGGIPLVTQIAAPDAPAAPVEQAPPAEGAVTPPPAAPLEATSLPTPVTH